MWQKQGRQARDLTTEVYGCPAEDDRKWSTPCWLAISTEQTSHKKNQNCKLKHLPGEETTCEPFPVTGITLPNQQSSISTAGTKYTQTSGHNIDWMGFCTRQKHLYNFGPNSIGAGDR